MREVSKPAASEMSCRRPMRPAFRQVPENYLAYRHYWMLYTVQAHQGTSSMGSAAECHDSTHARTTDCLLEVLLARHLKKCLVGPSGSPNLAATFCLL